MKYLDIIPDYDALENEDHAERLSQRIRLLLMVLLVLSAMIVMALEGGPGHPFLFWTGSAIVLFVLAFKQHAFLLNQNIALDKWEKPRIGLFMTSRIAEMYAELTDVWRNEKMPAPTLFIGSQRNRPAFTVRNCLTSDPRFHAVYISEDLFFWLKSDELKGILAHELAHYYRYSGSMMRCYPLVLAIMAFLPLTLLDLLHIRNLYLYAILWPLLHYLVRFLLLGLQRRGAYWQEYLADAEAVRVSSALDVVNGLLLVHKRMDNLIQAYRQVLRLLKKKATIPLSLVDDLIEELWAQLPRRIMRGQTVNKVVEDLLGSMVKGSPDSHDDLAAIRRRNRQIARMLRQSRPMVRRHLNWETLRQDRHNWRLDDVGYLELIESIMKQPDKQLTFFSSLGARGGSLTHPLLRKRILFIHKNFGTDAHLFER